MWPTICTRLEHAAGDEASTEKKEEATLSRAARAEEVRIRKGKEQAIKAGIIKPGEQLEKHHGHLWKKQNRNFVPYDEDDLEDGPEAAEQELGEE